MARKVPLKIIAGAVSAQSVIGALTVRDISRREKSEVRGPKLLWKIWGGTNTLGAALYWLVARRPGRTV